ncbi:MAG: L-seryl-tRNA(Sec) selenium transferase [Deltaproteobacteria bacterium]|jgi:L-seryl-tRNA(Ser) seleniumtransferase|nr:L-seryl-tRNA(Sec) selenium transferase [Deltaproteobacteria bacterium]
MDGVPENLRHIPQVEKVLAWTMGEIELKGVSRPLLVKAIREVLGQIRKDLLDLGGGQIPSEDEIKARVVQAALEDQRPTLRAVVNATGVVLHTNLGRSPLAQAALEQMVKVAGGYSTLEYDPVCGKRADRLRGVEELVISLSGAEAAAVVNNNAAALFLLMTVLGKAGRVVISRGELVEIGGSFRLAEIIEASGVGLKEVGSTNRTVLADYQKAAAGEDATLLLKVHASNFRQVGYTSQVTIAELVTLAREKNLPLVVDLGSGAFMDLAPLGILDETSVPKALSLGADVVCFSCDKLLGGPQAGLIAGRSDIVKKIKSHPLMRTVRPGKLTLAALETTLRILRDPAEAQEFIPTYQMLHCPPDQLRKRAVKLKRTLGENLGLKLSLVEVSGQIGGGAAPEQPLASWAVGLESQRMPINLLEEKLRRFDPPIVARIFKDRLLFDVRTIFPDQMALIKQALNQALGELAPGSD